MMVCQKYEACSSSRNKLRWSPQCPNIRYLLGSCDEDDPKAQALMLATTWLCSQCGMEKPIGVGDDEEVNGPSFGA
jgi:hypothetical protein